MRTELLPHPNTQDTFYAVQTHVFSRLADEAVILNMDKGVYYGLNAVGARVWELIQTPQTLSALCAAVTDEYAVDPEQCRQDIQTLLAEMQAQGLVAVSEASE